MSTSEKMLVALHTNFPSSVITLHYGYAIVKDKNLDTNKNEYHLYGITDHDRGFICTFPTMKMVMTFVEDICEESEEYTNA